MCSRRLAARALAALFAVSLPAAARAQPASTTADDSASVASLAPAWEAAWNAHDMARFAALLTDDVDFVTVGAGHLVGRRAVEADHAPKHAARFRESVLTNGTPRVRFLAPDVALVHVRWAMRGDRDADDGPRPPRAGLVSWVVVRTSAGWRIRAVHNTNATSTTPARAP